MTRIKRMKTLTSGLDCLSATRPPSFGMRDSPKRWLETIGDMTEWRSQCGSCIPNLSSSI